MRWSRLACAPLFCALAVACTAEVASNLDESQAGDVVVALDGAGIGARRERQEGSRSAVRYRVLVPRGELPASLAVLHAQGLPREPEPGWSTLFEESSLVPSVGEERARQSVALGNELARSIEEMQGVSRARVHLALVATDQRPLDAEVPSARASVVVTLSRDAEGDVQEDAIRTLVSGAVVGLDADAVVVVVSPATPSVTAVPNLVWIGPVAVSRGSATAFKAMLGGSFALHLLLAMALFYTRRRGRASGVVSRSSSVSEGLAQESQ